MSRALSLAGFQVILIGRFLVTTEDKPQIFGTQYPLDPNAPHPQQDPHLVVLTGRTLAPYDEQLLPDTVCLDFCVPNVAQQKQKHVQRSQAAH
jgi:hypothetical protein